MERLHGRIVLGLHMEFGESLIPLYAIMNWQELFLFMAAQCAADELGHCFPIP